MDQFGRLSETAATWVTEVLAVVTKERKYRKLEHGCLDVAEKNGFILQ